MRHQPVHQSGRTTSLHWEELKQTSRTLSSSENIKTKSSFLVFYFYTWSMSYVDSNYIRFIGGVGDGGVGEGGVGEGGVGDGGEGLGDGDPVSQTPTAVQAPSLPH